jgi:hypothetical protein
MSQNRTKWPVTGGALSFQPGWFNGHQTAFIYINIGLGTSPLNYSHPMVPVFQLTGPSNLMYPGTFCLPQIPLPANITYNIGDNATIQVIETAVHGAALFSVGAGFVSKTELNTDMTNLSVSISPLPTPRMLPKSPKITASIRLVAPKEGH